MSEARAAAHPAQAVVGYLPDALVKELRSGQGLGKHRLELPLDPGKGASVHVQPSDVQEVRVGPSHGGQTSVQLVLRPGAEYDIVTKATVKSDALTAIADPGLTSVLARLQWFVIYVGPIFRQDGGGVLREVGR